MKFTTAIFRKPIYLIDFTAEVVVKSVAFICLITIFLIFVFVFREAYPLFFLKQQKATTQQVDQSENYGEDSTTVSATTIQRDDRESSEPRFTAGQLAGTEWQPVSGKPLFGLLPLLWGSFKVTLIAILLAGPIGILAALYTTQFAPKWMKELLKPAIELLAGIPSVVIGFFALIVLATLFQKSLGLQYRLNAFTGGVALSLAVIPIIYTITEEALNAVPKNLSEAALALGATKWETALNVILPAATPGVVASLILGFGRAFGETMIVLLATGNAATLSLSPFEPVRTLSATIGAEMAEVVFGDTHYGVLFFIGTLLFLITFTLNAVTEFYVRKKLLKRFRGA